jgi:hypothetical protein
LVVQKEENKKKEDDKTKADVEKAKKEKDGTQAVLDAIQYVVLYSDLSGLTIIGSLVRKRKSSSIGSERAFSSRTRSSMKRRERLPRPVRETKWHSTWLDSESCCSVWVKGAS